MTRRLILFAIVFTVTFLIADPVSSQSLIEPLTVRQGSYFGPKLVSSSERSASFFAIEHFLPDETDRLLEQWARSGSGDPVVVDRLMRELNITSKKAEDDLIAKLRTIGKSYSGGPAAFESAVRETLDRRRYAMVDEAIQEVLAAYGSELEAVIRTSRESDCARQKWHLQ